jgi:hypothetical protein
LLLILGFTFCAKACRCVTYNAFCVNIILYSCAVWVKIYLHCFLF